MSDVIDLCDAIAEALADALEIPFVHERIDDTTRNSDIGCVFVESLQPATDTNFMRATILARVFLRRVRQRQPPAENALKARPLEELALGLTAAAKSIQVDLSVQAGYFAWVGTTIDHVLQGVEVTFQTWEQSNFAQGG